jgi:hypothetical protein
MPGPGKGRVKVIIMDKAPNYENLQMQSDLGYDQPAYQAMVDAFNAEFGTNVQVSDVDHLATVGDVVAYMETL